MKKGKKLSERIEKKRTDRKAAQWQRSKRVIDTRSNVIPSATRDNHLSGYVEGFVAELETLGPLPSTDLTTPESARAAVYVLNQKLAQIERFKKTAEALKTLLLSQGSEKDFN